MNKEKNLEFLKKFNNIKLAKYCRELGINSTSVSHGTAKADKIDKLVKYIKYDLLVLLAEASEVDTNE